jgi:hypothetical protein
VKSSFPYSLINFKVSKKIHLIANVELDIFLNHQVIITLSYFICQDMFS